jgi:hypothetical protein
MFAYRARVGRGRSLNSFEGPGRWSGAVKNHRKATAERLLGSSEKPNSSEPGLVPRGAKTHLQASGPMGAIKTDQDPV